MKDTEITVDIYKKGLQIHRAILMKAKEKALKEYNDDLLYYNINENDSIDVVHLKLIITELRISKEGLKRRYKELGYDIKNYNNHINSLKKNNIEEKTIILWCDLLSCKRKISYETASPTIDKKITKKISTII